MANRAAVCHRLFPEQKLHCHGRWPHWVAGVERIPREALECCLPVSCPGPSGTSATIRHRRRECSRRQQKNDEWQSAHCTWLIFVFQHQRRWLYFIFIADMDQIDYALSNGATLETIGALLHGAILQKEHFMDLFFSLSIAGLTNYQQTVDNVL